MTPPRPLSVAVIGAGWSGLTAAVTLRRQGAQVTLFESARQAGGRARRVDWQGLAIDNGQHLLIGAYRQTLQFLRSIGIDPDAAFLRIPMRVLVPGKMDLQLPRLIAPLHAAIGLLGTRGPSWREKISAARMMQALQSNNYRLPPEWTVTQWLDAHGQRGTLRDHLWHGLCLAALNTHPDNASAQVFANVLRDTLGAQRDATDFLLPRVDLSRLMPDAALDWLATHGANIRLATRVRRVEPSDSGWSVETVEQSQHFDRVIIATGPQHVAALLPEDSALNELRGQLAALCYEPIATAYLHYPPEVQLPTPILALNDGLAQWVVDRGQLDANTPGLLAHVLSTHGEWEEHSAEALCTALDRQMRTGIPSLATAAAPLKTWIIREQRATFQCAPGLNRPTSTTALPGLILAGDYVLNDYPATLEGAVRNGQAAAATVFRELAPACATTPPKRPSRWRSWIKEITIVVTIVLTISFWQTRDVPQGMAPDFIVTRVHTTPPASGAEARQTLSLAEWRARHTGRATVLYFFAEWCPICKLNEGAIDAVIRDHPVLPIAMQSGDEAAVTTYLTQRALQWPAVNDPQGQLLGQYGLHGVPAFIVLDPTGRIRFAEQGYTSEWGLRLRLLWANRVN